MHITTFGVWLRLAALSILAVTATACAPKRGGSIPYDVPDFAQADPLAPAVLAQDYKLAPGDKLQITVFRVEDLSGEYVVDLAGNIAFPLIGPIRAIDLTSGELAAHLERQLEADYLNNPDVTVGIQESIGRLIAVEGAVRQPGMFPVTSEMTLLGAVAMARGTDDTANPRRVAIFRRIEGERMAAAFDLLDIRGGEAVDPVVYAGDIVVVDGRQNRQLLRDLIATLPVIALFRPY